MNIDDKIFTQEIETPNKILTVQWNVRAHSAYGSYPSLIQIMGFSRHANFYRGLDMPSLPLHALCTSDLYLKSQKKDPEYNPELTQKAKDILAGDFQYMLPRPTCTSFVIGADNKHRIIHGEKKAIHYQPPKEYNIEFELGLDSIANNCPKQLLKALFSSNNPGLILEAYDWLLDKEPLYIIAQKNRKPGIYYVVNTVNTYGDKRNAIDLTRDPGANFQVRPVRIVPRRK